MVKKIIVVCFVCCFVLVGCQNAKSNPQDLETDDKVEITVVQASFVIDVNSSPEMVGAADYVIVGEVQEQLETEYRDPVEIETEDGGTKVVTTPFTHYKVQVTENLKGQLKQNEPICVIKYGGIEEDGSSYELYENDIIPEKGKSYIFFLFAQEDGSNLAEGPNSTIPLEEVTGREISTMNTTSFTLDEVRSAVPNQITLDRQRSVSNDAVS